MAGNGPPLRGEKLSLNIQGIRFLLLSEGCVLTRESGWSCQLLLNKRDRDRILEILALCCSDTCYDHANYLKDPEKKQYGDTNKYKTQRYGEYYIKKH